MDFFFGRNTNNTFKRSYKCKRVSKMLFFEQEKQETINNSGKILLPESALFEITEMIEQPDPMVFKIYKEEPNIILIEDSGDEIVSDNSSEDGNISNYTHVGVMEFTEEEGIVYAPDWIFERLNLREDENVCVEMVRLEKGISVKIQPLSSDFLEIHDHRSILEHHFRLFTALTEKDVISFVYFGSLYQILIVETTPKEGILIIDTDISVEFEAPPGYQPYQEKKYEIEKEEITEEGPFNGCARFLSSEEKKNKNKISILKIPKDFLLFYQEEKDS